MKPCIAEAHKKKQPWKGGGATDRAGEIMKGNISNFQGESGINSPKKFGKSGTNTNGNILFLVHFRDFFSSKPRLGYSQFNK